MNKPTALTNVELCDSECVDATFRITLVNPEVLPAVPLRWTVALGSLIVGPTEVGEREIVGVFCCV